MTAQDMVRAKFKWYLTRAEMHSRIVAMEMREPWRTQDYLIYDTARTSAHWAGEALHMAQIAEEMGIVLEQS